MKDHTDKAGIRCAIAAIGLALFLIIIWGPANTIWIGPWIYKDTAIGTLAWRKAWVVNGWILFTPIAITFGYCIFTMSRAIRKDDQEREFKKGARP